MIIVLSGTNRPGSNTKKVADSVLSRTKSAAPGVEVRMLDLAAMRPEIYDPSSYGEKPNWFIDEFQNPILNAAGLVIVTPEYNGSFPGVLKYFIDMLKFPESLVGLPIAIVGISAGQFGAVRSVEQLSMILHYRKAHLFGERLFIPAVHQALSPSGSLGELDARLDAMISGFVSFSCAIKNGK